MEFTENNSISPVIYQGKVTQKSTYDTYITNVTKFCIKFYIKTIGFDGFILQKNANYSVGEKIALKCNYVNFTSFDDINWIIL